MFKRGMILNSIKAAVMIGEHKPPGGDNLAGAESAEADDSILKASAVDAEDFFCAYLHAEAFHFFFIQLFQQVWQPHAFGGEGEKRNENKNSGGQQQVKSSHGCCFFIKSSKVKRFVSAGRAVLLSGCISNFRILKPKQPPTPKGE